MMKKSAVNISINIILFVLLNTANGDHVCNNDVIKCYNYKSFASICTIYQNNIDIVSQAISLCSAGSSTQFNIYIDSGLNSTTTIITLNLANNIQNVVVYGFATLQPVYILSTQTHPNVSGIRLYNLNISNSIIFYDKFSNLTSFTLNNGYFDTDFNFSTLKKLTSLSMFCSGQSNRNITMDKEWVGGLSKLQSLALSSCGIQNITTDAFENLTSLTYLDLGNNNILELAPEVFRDLTALKRLGIASNSYDIKIPLDSKNHNAFSPLKQLTSLYLSDTKIIPFDAFSKIGSIETLYLPSSGIVSSTPFQHLHNLTYLAFDGISLICNCSMQWASIIGKFGIIVNGWCSDSRNSRTYLTDSRLYTDCGLTESYQCFNKTVACKNTCINTPDSYICICDAGYGFTQVETACHDIDECSNSTWNTCKQHRCLNQVGSYRCICDPGYYLSIDGFSCHDFGNCSDTNNQQIYSNGYGIYSCICKESYKLSLDGTSCEDINECNMIYLNSCDHQCVNEPGSYRCICDAGFELAMNNISCHDTDECTNSNNSCNSHKCLNLVGSYTCLCGEGYNGMSCEDIDECSLITENSCGSHQCVNEQGSYRCVCDEGFQLAVNNISCYDTDECMDANNSCNPHTCLNLVGSYICLCGEGYTSTNGKTCEDRPTNASLPIQSTDTGYSSGTLVGVIVFLVIMIIVLILLLLTSLSITIYMCYNKCNTSIQFQEFNDKNQSEGKVYLELAPDVAAPDQRYEQVYSQIPTEASYYPPQSF